MEDQTTVVSTPADATRAALTAWSGPASRWAATLACGAVLCTVALSFGVVPWLLSVTPMNRWVALTLGAVGLALVLLALLRLPPEAALLESRIEASTANAEPQRSTRLYGLYLVGLGFALLTMSVLCSVVFSGLAWSVGRRRGLGQPLNLIDDPTKTDDFSVLFGTTPDEAYITLGLFVLSCVVAILGALFFFSTSLWSKMSEPEREAFDRRLFWGGLWFRMGEAVLFNLVFFLTLRLYAPDEFLLLPLVSLLVGMFLKAGESLVSGIATRVFASIQALVPTSLGPRKQLRLLTLVLAYEEQGADPAMVATRLQALVLQVRGLTGVEQAEAGPPPALVLKVEYDALAIQIADIQRKVELSSFRIVGGS